MTATHELIAQAAELIGTSDELSVEDFDAALAEWVNASDDKLFALRCVYAQLDGKAAGLRSVADDYAAAAAAAAAKAEAVKHRAAALYLVSVELGAPLAGGRMQPNSGPSLVFDDAFTVSALPPELIVLEPDKAAIKRALQAGAELPGCSLVRGAHFRWSVPR